MQATRVLRDSKAPLGAAKAAKVQAPRGRRPRLHQVRRRRALGAVTATA
jgi:hypothetical protein